MSTTSLPRLTSDTVARSLRTKGLRAAGLGAKDVQAAGLGALFGVGCATLSLMSSRFNDLGAWAAGHPMLPHAAGVLSRMIGSWWGWGAAPVIVAAVSLRRSRRAGGRGGWPLASLLTLVFLVGAVGTYYAVDPLVGVGFDVRSLCIWLVGAAACAPVMGLLAWVATWPTAWGTLVRVGIPLGAIGEVLLSPPAQITAGEYAWRELAGCLVLMALATLWAIVALAHGPRGGLTDPGQKPS